MLSFPIGRKHLLAALWRLTCREQDWKQREQTESRLLEQPRNKDGEVIRFRIHFEGRELASSLDGALHTVKKSATTSRFLARANPHAIYRARKDLRRMRDGGLPGYKPSRESFSNSMGSISNTEDRTSKVRAEDWVGQMTSTGHLDKSSFAGELETEVSLEYNSCS